jgi:hypothetical protein
MDIGTSFGNSKFMAQDLDLMLDLGEHGKVVGIDEDVSAVLKGRQQIQSLLQSEFHAVRRLFGWQVHANERSRIWGKDSPESAVPQQVTFASTQDSETRNADRRARRFLSRLRNRRQVPRAGNSTIWVNWGIPNWPK